MREYPSESDFRGIPNLHIDEHANDHHLNIPVVLLDSNHP